MDEVTAYSRHQATKMLLKPRVGSKVEYAEKSISP
jgi:hypothetical protein